MFHLQLRLGEAVEIALYDCDGGLMTWVEPATLLEPVLAKWNEVDYHSGEHGYEDAAPFCMSCGAQLPFLGGPLERCSVVCCLHTPSRAPGRRRLLCKRRAFLPDDSIEADLEDSPGLRIVLGEAVSHVRATLMA